MRRTKQGSSGLISLGACVFGPHEFRVIEEGGAGGEDWGGLDVKARLGERDGGWGWW